MGFDCYLMNLDGAVFPRLMLLFVNWFMPYGVVVTIVLLSWLINCSHQTFILSLNYFCCWFFNLFPFFLHSLLLYSHCSWALPAIEIKWSLSTNTKYVIEIHNRFMYFSTYFKHLTQRGGAWAGCGPAQSSPRCTKCNSAPINGQCTNHCIAIYMMVRCSAVLMWRLKC